MYLLRTAGADYNELPDVYVIYISEADLWHAGKAIYKVEKTLGAGKEAIPYDDGSHIIYVNAEVDDGSAIAQMMKYFKSADPERRPKCAAFSARSARSAVELGRGGRFHMT